MVSITGDSETGTTVLPSRYQQQHQAASSQSQFSSQNGTSSSLIFRPEPESQPTDVSPTCSTLPRVLEPLQIPQPSLPTEISPTTPHSSSSTQTVNPSSSSSNSGRRGSLAVWKIPQISESSTSSKTKLDNRNTSGSNTPTSEIHKSQDKKTNMRPSSSGSRKGKEVLEMITLPITDASAPLGAKQISSTAEERSKEDMAMAKWRKWVVEQPIQTVPVDHSPIRSRRSSPGTTATPALNTTASPRLSSLSSPRNGMSSRQFSPAGSPLEPVGSGGSAGSSSSSPGGRHSNFSPPVKSMRLGSGSASGDYIEVFNTESVMALRDVELAIDEEVLERNERMKSPHGIQNRRMSTQPRISELPNPFADIAHRLGSRRVRPIVLELIQALGHYLDAVWCITYPDRPCPWIIGVNESPIPPSVRRMTIAHQTHEQSQNSLQDPQMTWKSPMITAVQEGKKTGHVIVPPTVKDVKFWGDEVTFAIRDVDEVVGIYKGVGWAFGAAMRDGVYGTVSADNVLGMKGEGGGMARLLNDLEEAIWGDAQPRPTDLSYDLPIDFDPYAEPDDQELLMAVTSPRHAAAGGTSSNTRSALTDFFGESRSSSRESGVNANAPLPIMEEEIDALPDLVQPDDQLEEEEESDNDNDNKSDTLIKSPNLSSSASAAKRPKYKHNTRSNSTLIIPGITDFEGSEDLSLEELGKRRHREWLENQRMGGDAW
ncbi:uncharacterized protein L199_007218 [Kwoniella botswanensis]|uniref:uncharacterized protein n=1 Tax=Kwoniella botswanensis TaxID=1268659 RepID=UPI00315C5DE0